MQTKVFSVFAMRAFTKLEEMCQIHKCLLAAGLCGNAGESLSSASGQHGTEEIESMRIARQIVHWWRGADLEATHENSPQEI